MDDFEKFIDDTIEINKITLKGTYNIEKLTDCYYLIFTKHMLADYDHTIYYKPQFMSQYKLHSFFPIYNVDSNVLAGLSLDNFKYKYDDIIIIPVLIYNDINTFHIANFYINQNSKHVIYFDSYGIKNNELIKQKDANDLINSMKTELIINEIITDKYKFITLDHAWQLHIKSDNADWYYYYSCIVVQSMFSLYYMSISNYKLDKIINMLDKLNSVIKANPGTFKELLVKVYLTIMNKNK